MNILGILVFTVILLVWSVSCFESESTETWDADDEACFYARYHHCRNNNLPLDKQAMLHTALTQLYYQNGVRRPDSAIMDICSKYFQPISLPTDAELQEEVCYYASNGKFKQNIVPELVPYYFNALNAFYHNIQNPFTNYLVMSRCSSPQENIQNTKEVLENGTRNMNGSNKSVVMNVNNNPVNNKSNFLKNTKVPVNITSNSQIYDKLSKQTNNDTDIAKINKTSSTSSTAAENVSNNTILYESAVATDRVANASIDPNSLLNNTNDLQVISASSHYNLTIKSVESGFISNEKKNPQNNASKVIETAAVIRTNITRQHNLKKERVEVNSSEKNNLSHDVKNVNTNSNKSQSFSDANNRYSQVMESKYMEKEYKRSQNKTATENLQSKLLFGTNKTFSRVNVQSGTVSEENSPTKKYTFSQSDGGPMIHKHKTQRENTNTHSIGSRPFSDANRTGSEDMKSKYVVKEYETSQNKTTSENVQSRSVSGESLPTKNHTTLQSKSGSVMRRHKTQEKYTNSDSVRSGSFSDANNTGSRDVESKYVVKEYETSQNETTSENAQSRSVLGESLPTKNYSSLQSKSGSVMRRHKPQRKHTNSDSASFSDANDTASRDVESKYVVKEYETSQNETTSENAQSRSVLGESLPTKNHTSLQSKSGSVMRRHKTQRKHTNSDSASFSDANDTASRDVESKYVVKEYETSQNKTTGENIQSGSVPDEILPTKYTSSQSESRPVIQTYTTQQKHTNTGSVESGSLSNYSRDIESKFIVTEYKTLQNKTTRINVQSGSVSAENLPTKYHTSSQSKSGSVMSDSKTSPKHFNTERVSSETFSDSKSKAGASRVMESEYVEKKQTTSQTTENVDSGFSERNLL